MKNTLSVLIIIIMAIIGCWVLLGKKYNRHQLDGRMTSFGVTFGQSVTPDSDVLRNRLIDKISEQEFLRGMQIKDLERESWSWTPRIKFGDNGFSVRAQFPSGINEFQRSNIQGRVEEVLIEILKEEGRQDAADMLLE